MLDDSIPLSIVEGLIEADKGQGIIGISYLYLKATSVGGITASIPIILKQLIKINESPFLENSEGLSLALLLNQTQGPNSFWIKGFQSEQVQDPEDDSIEVRFAEAMPIQEYLKIKVFNERIQIEYDQGMMTVGVFEGFRVGDFDIELFNDGFPEQNPNTYTVQVEMEILKQPEIIEPEPEEP